MRKEWEVSDDLELLRHVLENGTKWPLIAEKMKIRSEL